MSESYIHIKRVIWSSSPLLPLSRAMEAPPSSSSSSSSSSSHSCSLTSPPHLFNADLEKAPIPVVPSNPPTTTTGNPCDQIHVLAVDDSILDRKVIEKLLRTSSYQVTTVDSGSKALEFLGIEGDGGSMQIHVKVGLIITDYCMPGMTGYDLLKRVKETSALKEIPVVIMSSENVPTRIQRCLDEGAKEFIMKPVQMADVERLKAHVRPSLSSPLASSPSSSSSSSSSSVAYRVDVDHQTSSVSVCNKRKFDSEGFEPSQSSSERRPARLLSGVIVA